MSKAKGKVCWRFAGALCFGTLLAAQETTERCFARTHKGNTKTLTKGSASWWMLEKMFGERQPGKVYPVSRI